MLPALLPALRLVDQREADVPAGPGSSAPNLAVAPDGSILLSWLEPLDASSPAAGHALRFSTLDPATGVFSAAQTITSGTDLFVNWADFPSLAVAADGRIVAHWLRRSGPDTFDYNVELSWSDDAGANWSPPVHPHRDSGRGEHGFVSLLPRADDLAAYWLDGRALAAETAASPGSGPDAHGPDAHHSAAHGSDAHGAAMSLRTTTLAGDLLGEDQLLDARTCDCCQTSAVQTLAGTVLFYRDRSEGEIRDIAMVREIDGQWSEPATVHDDGWVIAGCPVNGPMADAMENDVALAWFTAADAAPRVQVAFSSDAAASFATPLRIDEGNPEGRVAVRMLSPREALVTWVERTGDGAAVRMRRVHAEQGMTPAITVTPASAARAGGFPRLERSADWFALAWTETGTDAPTRVRALLARLADGAGPR